MAASSVDVELLLDRFLSASTATDCLESLENLQGKFRLQRFPLTKAVISGVDPKSKRPSHEVENLEEERRHAEVEEEERQSIAIDTLLSNASALRALCGLVASSKLPPSRSDTSNNNNSSSYTNGGMEVEGGDVVACELLSMLLLSSAARHMNNAGAANVAGGMTTEALQKQQRQQRRVECIAKTMLTFHYTFENGDSVADSVPALTPALLDCLCASSSLLSSNSDVTTSSVGVPPPSVYARVLTLQILQSLLLASPGTLREQLMMAPDGVNRLVDLLGHGPSAMGGGNDVGDEDDCNSVPEEVRNESILFLTSLASSSSMLARLITFSEGYDRSLKIALESSSSSTSSSSSSGGSGLSSGTTVPIDCLDLCLALAHGDEVARELFMGGGDGRGNLDRLAQLMDLRGTERYCNAERNAWWAKELKEKRYKEKNTESAVKEVVKGKEEPILTDSTIRKGGKRGKKSKDDLDEILSGASSSSSSSTPDVKKYHAVVQTASESEQKKAIAREPDDPPTPFLTPNESSIVDSVFNLILVLLRDGDENTPSTKTNRSKRRGRAKSIMSHNLVRYIVDCALYTLPPPGVDYVSGVPSPALQQKALVTMGVLGSLGDTVISEEESTKTSHKDSDKARAAMRKKEVNEECEIQTKLLFETMPIYLQGYVTAIDRLMYLCCTGAYSPIIPTDDNVYNDDERPEVISSLLSTYSISTFRSCLSSETASRMVLHSLAPPPPDETDETGSPLEPPVVTRLVTTLVDNLRFLQSRQQHHDGKSEGEILDLNEVFRATIGASGSAGALGVFLTNGEGDATREMLLRLSLPPSTINLELEQSSNNMIDFILQHVATYDPDSTSNISLHASSAYITVVLFKLLSEWVFGMPRAVIAVLSSPSSVSLGVLLRSKKGGESNSEAVPALCGLLLGLCLEYMTDPVGGASGSSISNDASEFDNIAWNRDTIMKMIQSMGVGKYLSMIDELKMRPLPLPYCNGEARSIIERRKFSSWYGHNVTLIRRHVVMALAGNREDDSDEYDADGPDGPNKSTSSVRSLRKMVSNQAQEIENLQTKLEDALLTITSQSMHIKELKRVTELGNSAETIDMMTEYSEKMAELEQMKKELRIDAETQTKLRMQTIAAKDNEIAVLQNELSESQTCVEEVRRDNDILREEMSGLSSAYNSLELQYHRTGSSSSTFAPTEQTAGGEAAFEHGVTSNSSAGENAVEQFASKYLGEVQFLREENARLREEGRAANEWMSMAVSKMEEMSGDNEALAQSLDEAISNLASTGSESESQSIQNHMELLRVREEGETKLKAKADEIANQQALVQQLKDRIVEMNENKDEPSDQEVKELHQVITRQQGELEGLRQASCEAQEWMATAVTHVETLTKEVQDKEKLLKLQGKSEDDSNELEDKLAKLENSLESVTSELSESQKAQEAFSMEISALKAEIADRLVRVGDMHSNDASKIGALAAELDQVKQEKITLEDLMNQFRSRSEEAQSQLVEVETKLNEATSQRDNLMNRVESFATLADNHSDSHDYKEEIKALQVEHREKIQELERMQNQILQDTDDNDARVDKVLQDIEAEKQRAEVLSQENTHLSAMIEELSLEKEHLSSTLSAQLRSAQGQLAEYEAKVNDLTYERDGLISRLESNSSVDNESIHLIQSLRQELDVKSEQLVQIQDQLIDDAEESEVKLNQLVQDLDAEKQRAEGLSQDKAGLSSMIEKLSIETEHISRVIFEKQALLDSINASKNDADMLAEESQRRVSELEQVLNVSTAQLHNFALLQDQINSITAERDEIKSQLTLLIEKYELASMSYQANQSLQNQISELMEKSTQQDSEKDTLQNALDEVMQAAEQWQQRTQSLESAVTSLEYQLEQQENEAAEAIALWESRCMTLEETGGDVIRQWEEKVQTLESDVSILENKVTQHEMEATDAIAQWEARFSALGVNEGAVVRQCEERVRSLEAQLQTKEDETSESKSKVSQAEQLLTAAKDEVNVLSKQIVTLKSSVAMMTPQIDILNKQIDEKSKAIENMQLYIDDKDVELADLATELQETHIDKQWQERSEQLEAQVTELENTIKETKTRSEENVRLWQERAESQEKEAADAIAQWDIRCATLTERIVTLELEFAAAADDADTSVVTLKAEMRENETRPAATVEELEIKCSDYQKRIDEYAADIDRVKSMCSVLQEVRNTAVKEKEESEIIALELKDELRHTNEQLQSYATDQFAKKATDMATQALREQMQQIRARYSADQDALRSEREARLSADEEVERLKSDLALLAQATEFDDDVDVHVRKMAKKMTAENVKAEREEMAQLRTTLERLREELGSCRWNERQSEDNAANARLHTSILEQEVSATKKDLQLLEQALEELESSKIDMIVSFEYRIEVLENDRLWIERSHEEEMLGIKKDLAESNEERDNFAYKLELCEKNNTALVYSTAHNEPGGKESESRLVKLQLERAQLLSKINELGINLERRVREAVAAQVSSSEAELIVEKQSRHLIETSLSAAMTELDNVKKQLSDIVSKDRNGDDQLRQVLKESLDDLQSKNEKQLDRNKVLQLKVETINKENMSTISDLRDKLQSAQEELRAHERESRFEAALAAEINHLRASSHTASVSTLSQALVCLDQNLQSHTWLDEGKESIDRNSAYVIEMYDYVCELKSSIVEERQMYKDLLAEHEDLLALLGQAGIEGIQ